MVPITYLHCTPLHARNERILLFLLRMTLDSSVTVHFRTVHHLGGDGLGFYVYDWRDMYICVGNDDSMWRISLKFFRSCFFVLIWQGAHYWWWLSPLSRLVLRVETLVVVHQNVCLCVCWFVCVCFAWDGFRPTVVDTYTYMLDPSTQPHTLIISWLLS